VTEAEIAQLRHDLRTPIAVIAGFSELLCSDRTLQEEQRRDYAERIRQAAGELRGILDRA